MQTAFPYTVTETLYEGEGTVLYRAVRSADRAPVILKVVDPRRCRPKSLDRQRSEYEFGRTLDLPGVARPVALDTFEGMPALVIEDFGGEPLERLLGPPMELERFLTLALRIASAVAGVHRQGVVHRDLKPENILVDLAAGEVRLADFGLASRLPREPGAQGPPQLIEGSLAYMSPEQMGRMNRAVDSRTDLYSLGVTFFQMLTGRLPFEARDPPEWVHCHVARPPPSPSEVVPEVPEAIAHIVLKLLAKMPDERYQTARGLKHDLERCLEQWRAHGRIDPFPLGERDTPDRLQIPQKLYGREPDVAALVSAFERVAETGSPELVLVSGYSGIGKSSVVNELQKPIAVRRGRFVAGKFDPHKRDVPYSTIVQAFRQVVLDLLAESDDEVSEWRRRLLDALGANARLVADVVPPVELVIGPQPPVPELPPTEAQNRFRIVFRQFIGVFARPEHPLALFLDDLQWADRASLALIEDLVTHPATRFLFVVGAYRDNEVTPAHPLSRTLEAVRQSGARVSERVLGPLTDDDLTALIADAVRARPAEVAPLAALVRDKTGANPFFAIQFLTVLDEERLIAFDEGAAAWRWDLERIRARGITENVVDLMIGKVRRLPPDTQDALEQLAALGSSADLGTLTTLLDRPEAQTQHLLWDALREGLVCRTRGGVRFVHDRIREAAYSLVPEESRPAMHLRIGRLLLTRLPARAIEEHVFDVANQLDRGIELVTDPEEREAIGRLDALAGRKAKASIAYGSARNYLALATALLPPEAWTGRYEEAFALHLDLAECEYLAGDFRRAEESLDRLLGNAGSDLDRARVHLLRMRLYQGSGRFHDALRTGLDGLRLFGVSFPETEPEITAAFEAETREIRSNLGDRRAADLVDAPEIAAPELRMILRLLIETWVPAYNAQPELHKLLMAKAVSLSLRHGNTEESVLVYSGYVLLLVAIFGDLRSAGEFADAAVRLAEKSGDARARAAALGNCGALGHWWKPIPSCLPLMDRSMHAWQEIGYLANGGVTAIIAAWNVVVEQGLPLDEALEASKKYVAFAEESRNDTFRDTLRMIRQLVPALRGTTRGPASFDADDFSESAYLAAMAKASYGAGIALHHILKQIAAFLYERYDEALEATVQKTSVPEPVSPFLYDATHHFFGALTVAALHPQASADRRAELAGILDEELRRHRLWAESCPENFQHRHALIAAEMARLEGRELDAERLYEEAIHSAHENGFLQYEALASELTSRFYRKRGFDRVADTYLRDARTCYLRWGARGKVNQLDQGHPRLLEPRSLAPTATFAARAEQLDFVSVAKASQSISGEIVLDRLLRTLLQVVLEQGGAQRGSLLLARDGDLSIDAEATLDGSGVRAIVLQSAPVGSSSPRLPASLVKYVHRTKERVILEDPAAGGKFASDAYIARKKPRSVLCLPILRQTQAVGVLYLENDLVTGAFTHDRLIALELIATQAAISLQNASLLAKEQAARAGAEEARSRSTLLADAAALFSESLDDEQTLARVARICVQSIADWCVIDLLVGDGHEVRRVSGAHADPAKEPLVLELRRYPPQWESPSPGARVLRTGELFLRPEMSEEEIRASTQDDAHARLVRELGTRSALAVPLVARGQLLGAISLFSARRRFGPGDLDLAHEIANRAAIAIENARLFREAQEAIHLRDEFLSVASHELYTPITSLMLSVEAMAPATRTAKALDPRAMQKLIDLVSRQGRRLIRLVGDLLDVSRIETGRLELELAEVDLAALVREVIERIEPDLVRSRCVVSIDASAPVMGRWDRSRLDQVITNLLSNAVKFAPGTPVQISIGAEGGVARLVVRDRGIGINPDRQPRIFDRFERAASPQHYGGLGLGLYISRRIVEAHGGSIHVESLPGAGSTFTVELPRARPSEGAGEARWGA